MDEADVEHAGASTNYRAGSDEAGRRSLRPRSQRFLGIHRSPRQEEHEEMFPKPRKPRWTWRSWASASCGVKRSCRQIRSCFPTEDRLRGSALEAFLEVRDAPRENALRRYLASPGKYPDDSREHLGDASQQFFLRLRVIRVEVFAFASPFLQFGRKALPRISAPPPGKSQVRPRLYP